MCGRYTLNKKADDIAKRYNLAQVPKKVTPNYNVAPSQVMPVVTKDSKGNNQLELMKWGIPRILGKDLVKELINTRSDKAFGGFWKKTVINQRCLIPSTGFYEWKAGKEGKVPFFIHPKFADIYSFAGIWSTWKNEDGQEIKVYSIMTTEPNEEMKAVHNRMPVILHPEDESDWIEPSNGQQDVLEKLLFPLEDHSLEIYKVSIAVNNPRNNEASLLAQVA